MRWLISFRPLLVIYAIAGAVALVEITLVHRGLEPQTETYMRSPDVATNLAEVYAFLYPQRMAAHYVGGVSALRSGQYEEARRCFEAGLAVQRKDESLLYDYAATLILLNEKPESIDKAIHEWRWNFPHSKRPDPREIVRPVPRPREAGANYTAGLEALMNRRFEEAKRHFERELETGNRSEPLLYNYIFVLLALDAEPAEVDRAVRAWRQAFPFSKLEDPRVALEKAMRAAEQP